MSKTSESLDRKRAAMTEAFVKAVETAGKWFPDWISARPRNFITGKAYRGVNRVMLPVAQMVNGWTSPLFAGKGQIKAAGGRIKDDEFRNATWVFFWGRHEKVTRDSVTGEKETRTYWFPKAYQVWNVEQTEGVKPERIKGMPTAAGADTIAEADAMLFGYMDAEGIELTNGDPAYWPTFDRISMPERAAFHGTAGYYNALAHECGHSTGKAERCDRDLSGMKGGHKYSKEELVAQLCAAYFRAEFGLTSDDEEARDAAYLRSWLDAMKADPSMLFDAAGDAEKALDFIREKAGVPSPETVEVE